MEKKLQDVTPPKRSIHDIPLPNGKARKNKSASSFSDTKKKKTSFLKKFIFLVVILVVFIGLFITLTASSVEITVTPRIEEKRTDASFIAVSDKETGGIPFDIIMLDKSETRSVPAIGQDEVKEKASGEIIIFNDFDSNSQRLIKNTRFETSEGLVYRIQNSVVVPGQKKDENGKLIPGSIEVTVYADEAGEDYNIGLKDFTIPGFKGSERFDAFYARSKTPMTGGYKGIKKVADEDDVEAMQNTIEEELATSLKEEIKGQVPNDFVLYEDGIFSESRFLGTKEADEGVGVEQKVVVYAVIFNKENLSKYIAENSLDDYKGGDLIIKNIEDLSFEIKNKDKVQPWVEGRFVFSLKGETQFEWLFSEEDLKNDFVGKDKEKTNEILSQYPSIDSANVVIKPFWKNSFPRSSSKIIIKKTTLE